jgi:hypothetical protein
MRYFQIVKSALDALLAGICAHKGLSGVQALKMVEGHLRTMSKEWFSGEAPNIAYGDPLCRFAYLYSHTAVNANLCEVAVRSLPAVGPHILDRLNTIGELRVCAFGGGPGTELLALSKFLTGKKGLGQLQPHGEVNFTLLDYVPEWAESWNALEAAIKRDFLTTFGHKRDWPFSISKSFQPFDMTKVEQYANLVQLFEHDLYVMNYVLSEIFSDHPSFAALFNQMAARAPSGAQFVIIDRKQDHIVAWARELMAGAGLVESGYLETSTNMDYDEQKAVLDDYQKYITLHPRITWNGAFCISGTKP